MAQINLGHVVGPGVPSGGTADQILKKNGSTNYDTSWATLNSGNIPISASDNTTVQQSLAAVKSDIGIVEDGNTATHTIAAGQYVVWKGALYTASAAIPSGTTLSSSNLTAVSDGGLNALNGNFSALTGNTKLADWTEITTYSAGERWGGSFYCKIGKITYVQINVKGLTANTFQSLFQLPNGCKPLFAIEFDGFGGLAYLNHAHFKITDNGVVSVYSADTYATGFIAFPSL